MRPHHPADRADTVASSAVVPAPDRLGVAGCPAYRSCVSPSAGDALGLEVSLGGFFQDQCIQGEVGDGTFQSRVLALQLFESLGLIDLEPAVGIPPAIVGLFCNSQGAAGLCDGLPLEPALWYQFLLCFLPFLPAGDLCSKVRRASRIIGSSMRFLKRNWLMATRFCLPARTSSMP